MTKKLVSVACITTLLIVSASVHITASPVSPIVKKAVKAWDGFLGVTPALPITPYKSYILMQGRPHSIDTVRLHPYSNETNWGAMVPTIDQLGRPAKPLRMFKSSQPLMSFSPESLRMRKKLYRKLIDRRKELFEASISLNTPLSDTKKHIKGLVDTWNTPRRCRGIQTRALKAHIYDAVKKYERTEKQFAHKGYDKSDALMNKVLSQFSIVIGSTLNIVPGAIKITVSTKIDANGISTTPQLTVATPCGPMDIKHHSLSFQGMKYAEY